MVVIVPSLSTNGIQPINNRFNKGVDNARDQDCGFKILSTYTDGSIFILGVPFLFPAQIYRSIKITNTAITGGTVYSLDLYKKRENITPTTTEPQYKLLEEDIFNAGVISMATARLGNAPLEVIGNTTLTSLNTTIADLYKAGDPTKRGFDDLLTTSLVLGLTAKTIGTSNGRINIRLNYWATE